MRTYIHYTNYVSKKAPMSRLGRRNRISPDVSDLTMMILLTPPLLPQPLAILPPVKAIGRERMHHTRRTPSLTWFEEAVPRLQRDGPATAEVTGWQAHSVRGFTSTVIKKKLYLNLVSEVGKDGQRS